MKKIFIAALLAVVPVVSYAQSLPVASFNPDARSAGMADTYTPSYGGGFSIYTNSAAASLSDRDFALDLGYTGWQPEFPSQNNLAFGAFYKFADRFTVSLGMRGVLHNEVSLTDENGAVSGTHKPSEFSVDASFGMRIFSGFAAAVNVHYLSADYVAKGSAFAADVDLMYSHRYFNVAASVKNIGTPVTYNDGTSYALPAEVRAGVSGSYGLIDGVLSLSPAADVSYYLNSQAASVGVGAEFALFNVLSVRGGYRYSSDITVLPSYATVGLGLDFFGISVNAAYYVGMAGSPVGNSFKLGLGYSF